MKIALEVAKAKGHVGTVDVEWDIFIRFPKLGSPPAFVTCFTPTFPVTSSRPVDSQSDEDWLRWVRHLRLLSKFINFS
jgi:hypothetical protein